jgi:hypothetical protein
MSSIGLATSQTHSLHYDCITIIYVACSRRRPLESDEPTVVYRSCGVGSRDKLLLRATVINVRRMLTDLVANRRRRSCFQRHRGQDDVFLDLPEGEIQVLGCYWESHWGRRAVGGRQQGWKHSDSCYNTMLWSCGSYSWIDHHRHIL